MSISIDLKDMELYGRDLVRPEGVMVLKDGTVWCAHGQGHCTRINPDGSQDIVGELGGEPNGLCMDADENVIIANIGNGEVQRLHPDGTHEVIADTMDGRPMPSPNFPYVDRQGRLWFTNSTNLKRHFDGTRRPIPDGSVCLMQDGKARIMAEGLLFANGMTLDEKEEYVYAAESMGRCVVRYEILDNGELGRPEPYGPELGPRGYPDGIAFDAAGNLWITLVGMNALSIITPEREHHIVVEDPDAKFLNRPTNITWGGTDLRTAYIGSLNGTAITRFETPEPGMPLVHQL